MFIFHARQIVHVFQYIVLAYNVININGCELTQPPCAITYLQFVQVSVILYAHLAQVHRWFA